MHEENDVMKLQLGLNLDLLFLFLRKLSNSTEKKFAHQLFRNVVHKNVGSIQYIHMDHFFPSGDPEI